MVEGEVPVAEEAHPSPRILVDLVPGAPRVGVDGVRENDARGNDALDTGSLLGGLGGKASAASPVEKRAVTWAVRQRPCSIRGYANSTHFWTAFVSLQMARSLCIVPLERVSDAFSTRGDANYRLAYCTTVYALVPHLLCTISTPTRARDGISSCVGRQLLIGPGANI
jgi:hypothetical protein